MRGGTLLILGQGVKGQDQLWHSVYKTLWAQYKLQFYPNHFQTSHVSCGWWEEEPYWFWVAESKVKVNFGTLCIRHCGHNTNYSLSHLQLNFTCRLCMMKGGTLLILGQGQFCPPARGCHALHCLALLAATWVSFKIQNICWILAIFALFIE